MIAETIPQLKDLTIEQKFLLAAELWVDAANQQTDWESEPDFVASLEKQLAEFRRDPSTAMSLDDFKRRFLLP